MQYSIVKLSEVKINHDYRIDAEFYHPKFLENAKSIVSEKHTIFSNLISKITNGDDFRKYLDNGKNYIKTGDFNEYGLSLDNVSYVSEQIRSNIRLELFDLLITRKGNYGKSEVVYNNEIKNSFISSEIFHIKLCNINPFFIKTYLSCCFGKNEIERHIHGVSNFSITQDSLKEIKIPILKDSFQTEIANLVKKSYDLQEQAKELYKTAEDILLTELNLKEYKPKHKLTYIKSYKDTTKAGRIDAEYFQPKYDDIIDKIKKSSIEVMDNLVTYTKGIEVGSDEYLDKNEEGINFYRVSDFSINGFKDNAGKKISKLALLNLENKPSIKKDDILFTKDGTIGITYVADKDDESILSGAFLKLALKNNNIEKEYLALILNSIIVKIQIEQLSGGAIIAHLKPSDFMKIQIPILNNTYQKQINEYIKKSKQLKKQAKQLLDIAIKSVETAIETDENTATNFIKEQLKKL